MKLLLTVIKRIHKPAVDTGLHRCASSRPLSDPGEPLIVGSSKELVQKLGSQVQVRTGFITVEEEQALLRELDPGLKKKRYEFDHWDDVSLLAIRVSPLIVNIKLCLSNNYNKRCQGEWLSTTRCKQHIL